MSRDITATTFVVWGKYTLLHRHPKLGLILPPGGHVEENETPDAAAVREVLEETGLQVSLQSADSSAPPALISALTTPLGVLLEDIREGHQHVDLLYIGNPVRQQEDEGEGAEPPEVIGFHWYHYRELNDPALPPSVQYYGQKAIAKAAQDNPLLLRNGRSETFAERNHTWKRSRS